MFHPVDHPLERGWVGRVDGEHVVQLAAQTLQSFFTGGGSAREHAVFPLEAVRLLAPVLHPPSVRVFDDETSFAFANPAAIVGPGAGGPLGLSGSEPQGGLVVCPRLAAMVGLGGQVGGFTLLAEWRDSSRRPPKDRDFALGLGPVVVTPDELDPDGLEAAVLVDGEESLRGRFERFDWGAARDLAAAGTALYPGDLLAGPALGSVEVEPGSSVALEAPPIGTLDQLASRD